MSAKEVAFRIPLHLSGELVLGPRTLVMGVLNVTPDSFSDGGDFLDPGRALNRALRMVEEGADLIDIGGESTRPGATPVSPAEEQRRILPVVKELAGQIEVPISVDTRRGETARLAIAAGAEILNDVSGLSDPQSVEVAAATGVPVILMHCRGTPETMRELVDYDDVVSEVAGELAGRVRIASEGGVSPSRILLDPGIGFAKTAEQSFTLIRRLPELARLGHPLVLGPSRKSFLGAIADREPKDRLHMTLGAVAACVAQGAHIVRVHDVRPAVDAIRAFVRCTSV